MLVPGLNKPRTEATTATARAALEAQASSASRFFGVSLDAIWRACGEPVDESPTDWLDLAKTIVQGMSAYRRRLHDATGTDQLGPLVPRDPIWPMDRRTFGVVESRGAAGPLAVGDWMADVETAGLYALYIDRGGMRRKATRQGFKELAEFAEATRGAPRFRSVDPTDDPA